MLQRFVNARSGVRGGFARAFKSLAIPEYRLLWIGMLFSIGALQIDMIIRAWLAYDLSDSGLALGIVVAARGFSRAVLAPLGGVAADRFDKRKLLVISQSIVFSLAAFTAVLVHTGLIQVWHLAAIGLAQGIATPFMTPTRTAMVPELVPEEQVSNALALESTARNLDRIVAPAFAGVLLAWNPALAFYAVAIVYGAAVLTLANLPGGLRGDGAKQGAFAEIGVGFRYVFGRPALLALISMAFIPILIGMPFQSLLPVFQLEVLEVNERALGYMYTAVGIGAIIGSIVVASISETPHKGKIQTVAGVAFGVTLALFAMSTNYVLSLVLLLVVGFFSTGYLTLNRVMIAVQTDRGLFGRVMSIYGLTWSLRPVALLPIGALVDFYGVQSTVVGCGLVVAVLISSGALAFSRHVLRGSTGEPARSEP